MLRLTKDLCTPHDDTTYADIVKYAVDRENIVLTRLKHYEDIEEELGIDLIFLFRILKNRKIMYKYDVGILRPKILIEEFKIDGLAFDDGQYGLWIYDKYEDNGFFVYTKDYGKTWALTREELKDET